MTLSTSRLLLLPLAVALLAGCGSQAASSHHTTTAAALPTPVPVSTPVVTGGSVAAVVNGHSIPMSTFRLYLTLDLHQMAGQQGVSAQTVAQQAMNEVIVNELIREYAAAHGIKVTPAEVNLHVQQDIARTGGKQGFERQLAAYGLTDATYKQMLVPSLLGQLVSARVAPPLTAPQPVAHVRHILISPNPANKPPRGDAAAHALALGLLGKIEQAHGANFAALARKWSDDTASARAGGDLGEIPRGYTVPPFDHAAFTLPLDHPALVHTQYGYHIIEVLSRGKKVLPAQNQAQSQQQRFSAWLQQQMQRASIKRIAQVK